MALFYPNSLASGMKTFSLKMAVNFPIFIAPGVNFLAVQSGAVHANSLEMCGILPIASWSAGHLIDANISLL